MVDGEEEDDDADSIDEEMGLTDAMLLREVHVARDGRGGGRALEMRFRSPPPPQLR